MNWICSERRSDIIHGAKVRVRARIEDALEHIYHYVVARGKDAELLRCLGHPYYLQYKSPISRDGMWIIDRMPSAESCRAFLKDKLHALDE